jgi:chromosome segregation ATPase
MTDTTDLVAELRDEVLRLSGRSIDRGCVDSGLASLLAEKAADTIERLTRERDEARAAALSLNAQLQSAGRRIEHADAAAEAHEAKWKSICKAERSDDGMCACSYDKPDDVCAFHSPKMAKAEARIAKLEAAIEKLRGREVQALHAGLSLRNWHDTETAANQLRDRIDDALADRRRDAARAVAVGGE